MTANTLFTVFNVAKAATYVFNGLTIAGEMTNIATQIKLAGDLEEEKAEKFKKANKISTIATYAGAIGSLFGGITTMATGNRLAKMDTSTITFDKGGRMNVEIDLTNTEIVE